MAEKETNQTAEGGSNRRSFIATLWTGLGIVAFAQVIWLVLSFLRPRKPKTATGDYGGVISAGAVESFTAGTVTAFPIVSIASTNRYAYGLLHGGLAHFALEIRLGYLRQAQGGHIIRAPDLPLSVLRGENEYGLLVSKSLCRLCARRPFDRGFVQKPVCTGRTLSHAARSLLLTPLTLSHAARSLLLTPALTATHPN